MTSLRALIKNLNGNEVNTKSYLEWKAVGDLANSYSVQKTDQHLWPGPAFIEFNNMIIGGYGDTTKGYGAGPTRLVNSASYYLRMFDVNEGIDLVNFFGVTDKVSGFIDKIRKRAPYDSRYSNGYSIDDKHVKLASVNVAKGGVHICGLATNVHKDGLTYKGDLSLYVAKNLGHGYEFGMSNKTIEALSENNNGVLACNRLQSRILNSMEQMGKLANDFKMNSDYRLWILTVDNI